MNTLRIRRKMHALLPLAFGLLAAPSFVGRAQERSPALPSGGPVVSRVALSGRPTVFLSFDHADNGHSSEPRILDDGVRDQDRPSGPAVRRIWLRLHNNTPWTIVFPTESLYVGASITAWHLWDGTGVLGLRDGITVSARYQLEKTPSAGEASAQEPGPSRIDVWSNSWLPPGRSVLFAVPSEYINKRQYVYLLFNYEWETIKGVVGEGEPEHRVRFDSSQVARARR